MHTVQRMIVVMAAALLAGCATTGATWRSGVGDTFLEHPPWYAGVGTARLAQDNRDIAHVTVMFQRGATQPAIFDPRADAPELTGLLADVNRFLDSLGISTPIGGRSPADAVAPDVRFGCLPEGGVPGNDCAERGDSALGRGSQLMQLSVGRPSSSWVQWLNGRAGDAGPGTTLVVTLEIGQYLMRQEGLAGTKVLELGTNHRARLPWLTSLETPVTVLQLTAALVDRDGRALRIGAEGFHARRTRLAVSAIGAQELLTDEDVRAAREARRDDLPGTPLAWQVALRELVQRVTGRSGR